MRTFQLVRGLLVVLVSVAGCQDRQGVVEDDGVQVEAGFDDEGLPADLVAICAPTMSLFPVRGAHNIGFDGPSCASGHCDESCPDVNANSDYAGRNHRGIDVFAHRGAELQAVADGTIMAVGVLPNRVLRVRLRDACGWEYWYGHLEQAFVTEGQVVTRGDVLGTMGNTGTEGVHLHFNVSPDGDFENDLDPFALLVATSATACRGDDGCSIEQRGACGFYGCGCVDGACSGGACPGTGCTGLRTEQCAYFGCGCVDGACSGGACEGTGCTWKQDNDCGAGGCGCVDGACSGGACEGTGCTWRRTNDCGAYGCGCSGMSCAGGACP